MLGTESPCPSFDRVYLFNSSRCLGNCSKASEHSLVLMKCLFLRVSLHDRYDGSIQKKKKALLKKAVKPQRSSLGKGKQSVSV